MKNPKTSTSSKPPPSSSHKHAPSSSDRKSRWESADGASTPKETKAAKPLNPKELENKEVPSSSAVAIGGPGRPSPAPVPGGGSEASPFPAPTPPTYGFQNLERRTIVLFDGSVRSYFALPRDYPSDPYMHGFDRFSPDRFRQPPLRDFGAPRDFNTPNDFGHPRDFGPPRDHWLDGPRGTSDSGPSSMKRKYPEEDEFAWHRHHISQYGNPNPNLNPNLDRSPMRSRYEDDPRASKQVKLEGGDGYDDLPVRRGRGADDLGSTGHAVLDVDPQALKRAYLKFAKMINENADQRNNYLEDGKNGPLQCIVCNRASKEFSDVHGLIMHAYNTQNPDLRVDHLGLHKTLCVLMGWNYEKEPENSKAYQSFSAADASANRDDLIIWPPTVIVHNTNSGKRKDGRMEGMGNKEMDMKLKDMGFGGGKSKSMYGKEGHLGITVVKFANTQAGLKDAERLAEYFEKDNHGRRGWARAQSSQSGGDEETNPALVDVDPKNGEKKRILYGYLATASDLDKVDFDMKKKAVIKSRRDLEPSE